jgi:hypothetical protein
MAGRLKIEDYTVGWISALPIELAAAAEMLDEEHQDLPQDPTDSNKICHKIQPIATSIPSVALASTTLSSLVYLLARWASTPQQQLRVR